MNRDPLEEQGGWNVYGFITNDAINHFDVLGLAKELAKNITNENGMIGEEFFWQGYFINKNLSNCGETVIRSLRVNTKTEDCHDDTGECKHVIWKDDGSPSEIVDVWLKFDRGGQEGTIQHEKEHVEDFADVYYEGKKKFDYINKCMKAEKADCYDASVSGLINQWIRAESRRKGYEFHCQRYGYDCDKEATEKQKVDEIERNIKTTKAVCASK